MTPPVLTYASGRVQITRDADTLVIDFPPEKSVAAFWFHSTFTLGVSLLCLVGTFWPGGVTRLASSHTPVESCRA